MGEKSSCSIKEVLFNGSLTISSVTVSKSSTFVYEGEYEKKPVAVKEVSLCESDNQEECEKLKKMLEMDYVVLYTFLCAPDRK